MQRYKKYFICNSFVLFYSEKFYLIKPDDLLHLSIILLKFAQNDQIMKTNHLIFSLLLILTHLSSYADIVKVGHATYSTDWYEETATLTKGEFYQFNLSSCIRQQNSLTAQFVSFSLSNLANIFYPPQFLQ